MEYIAIGFVLFISYVAYTHWYITRYDTKRIKPVRDQN